MSVKRQRQDVVNGNQKWLEAEKEFVRKNYLHMRSAEMARRLGRTPMAVREFMRVNRLSRQWSDNEIALLKSNWADMGMKVQELMPWRTYDSIAWKAAKLHLKAQRANGWTVEEEQILRDNYPIMTGKEVGLILGRTVKSIQNRAKKLGLTKRGNA